MVQNGMGAGQNQGPCYGNLGPCYDFLQGGLVSQNSGLIDTYVRYIDTYQSTLVVVARYVNYATIQYLFLPLENYRITLL